MKLRVFILSICATLACQQGFGQDEWQEVQVHEITYRYIGDETEAQSFRVVNKANHLKQDSKCQAAFQQPTPLADVFRQIFPPARARELSSILFANMIIDPVGRVRQVTFDYAGGGKPITFEEYYRLEKALKEYVYEVIGGCPGELCTGKLFS
ncbi:MAG: hypothetical protein LBU80_02955 [Rikenellaceae bacterium]|jgi:hypothetical protein|nr:hypothetical protein [Rikenellaceae bacterium]